MGQKASVAANLSKQSRVLEAKKVIVYLTVPVACVWLYNHPWLHPHLARHTPAYPPNDPEHDAELERVLELAYKERAARLEKKAAAEEAARKRQA